MITQLILEKFRALTTPFYYYDMNVLRATLDTLKKESENAGYKVHYAIKSNHNHRILKTISSYGFGADCVSGNEITAAIAAGFKPADIVFAGVGKTDHEIELALDAGINYLNFLHRFAIKAKDTGI
jgi:diaminopimelate decarboxylase